MIMVTMMMNDDNDDDNVQFLKYILEIFHNGNELKGSAVVLLAIIKITTISVVRVIMITIVIMLMLQYPCQCGSGKN